MSVWFLCQVEENIRITFRVEGGENAAYASVSTYFLTRRIDTNVGPSYARYLPLAR